MSSLKDKSYGALIGALVDEDTSSVRTTITNAEVDINVSAFTDSIAIADAAGTKVTVTDVAGKKSLDVNVTDIALSHASDSVRLGDGSQLVGVSDVDGQKALKVDVLSMPAGGAGLTDNELRATPVPVSGTFYQATQPVSGSVSVSNFPSSQAVTGTFFQATQPVSLATAPTTPVTGTFWQATQPVSGTFWQATQPVSIASMPSTPVTGTFWQATQPVSGTFWQATQPVSASSLPLPAGAATETTLASLNTKTPALGQAAMASSQPVVIASNQSTIPVSFAAASVTFKGRASTFNTPGRAGTAGQKILSLHNASGSAVTVTVSKVVVDLAVTVVKAITVPPPMVRLWKVTVLPSNGTALTKNKIGGTGASSSSVTVLGDASADGTGSASTLTATLPAGAIITQEYAPRFVTAAGYEPADRMEFLGDTTITLGALEGLVLFLDYTLATQNPTTDRWLASIEWTEV